MKNKELTKKVLGRAKRLSRALVVMIMLFALVMNAEAQQRSTESKQKRMMEFQVTQRFHPK